MLIKTLNLSIKKHTSNIATMLTYFRYFLDYLQPPLTKAGGIKTTFIKDVFAKNIFTGDISRSTCMDIRLSSISC